MNFSQQAALLAFKNWCIDFIKKYAAFLITVISLIIAIKSCEVSLDAVKRSKEGNDIASKALESSKELFYQTNRPYLDVSIRKFKDSDSYLRIIKKDKSIIIEVQFAIRNNGTIPAVEISSPSYALNLESNLTKDSKLNKINKPGNITLHPDKEETFQLSFDMAFNESDLEKNYQYFTEGKSHLSIQVPIKYSNLLNKESKYVSTSAFDVTAKEARIITKTIN